MIWRECRDTDEADFIRLTREPMDGRIRLVWGLESLRCPAECSGLRSHVLESGGETVGCAMAWDWPGGRRYLGGLRLANGRKARPKPDTWHQAFGSMLEGADHGWTCIGDSNRRARRLLQSGVSWLPRYHPVQEITTWFIPLKRSQALGQGEDDPSFITRMDWRFVSVASGSGMAYRAGRLLHVLGQAGIASPGRPIHIANFHPPTMASRQQIRGRIRLARGFDGLIVALPSASTAAAEWSRAAPRLSWSWKSTLYVVSWEVMRSLPAIPDWQGHWL